MSDRASEVIQRGDPGEILRMALGARFAAEEGRYCECPEPSLHGWDLMCGHCLLENEGQVERRTAYMNGPHSFEPDRDEESAAFRLGMCRMCAMWEDDPRHQPPPCPHCGPTTRWTGERTYRCVGGCYWPQGEEQEETR